MEPTPILSHKLVDRCHVILPDTPKPIGAIYYDRQYYAYVKCFPTVEIARRKAELMTQRGNTVLLTRIPKGLVLWVLEPDAKPVPKPAPKSASNPVPKLAPRSASRSVSQRFIV
jgi:hypothetical protein